MKELNIKGCWNLQEVEEGWSWWTSGLVDKSEKEDQVQWACNRKVPGNASGSLRSIQPYYHIKGGEPPIGTILLPQGRQKTEERSKGLKVRLCPTSHSHKLSKSRFPHHSTLPIIAMRAFPPGRITETVHHPQESPILSPIGDRCCEASPSMHSLMLLLQGTPPSLRDESGIAVNLRHHNLDFHTRCPHKLVLYYEYIESLSICSHAPLCLCFGSLTMRLVDILRAGFKTHFRHEGKFKRSRVDQGSHSVAWRLPPLWLSPHSPASTAVTGAFQHFRTLTLSHRSARY